MCSVVYIFLLSSGFIAATEDGDELQQHALHAVATPENATRVVEEVLSFAQRCYDSDDTQKSLKALPWGKGDLQVHAFEVATQPASLHCFVHRVLARFLVDSVQKWNLPLTLSTFLSSEEGQLDRLYAIVEPPLRTQVLEIFFANSLF